MVATPSHPSAPSARADAHVSRTSALIPAVGAPSGPARTTAVLAAAAGLVFAAGALSARVMAPAGPAPTAAAADPCALPAGIDGSGLGPAEQAYLVRRGFLCRDAVAGRISPADYRAAVADLDHPVPPATPPGTVWAASVRDRSSQWSDGQWSAQRVLGPPDVFPAHGDNVDAWASSGADDRVEYLEVGLERATRLSAVEIFETYNPGAISAVELIGADGRRLSVYQAKAAPAGVEARKQRIELGCTDQPVVAIRVTLDSPAVPGWNEIDAIGGVPCT